MLILGSCKKNTKDTTNQLPVINKITVSTITDSSVTFSVDIASTGLSNIINKGIVISTDSLPTLEKNFLKTNNGSGGAGFTVSLSGLAPSRKYYARGYATNSFGTGYGNSVIFNTLSDSLPIITTLGITNISYTSAVSGGDISDSGKSSITGRGIVCGTDSLPTLNHNVDYTIDGSAMNHFIDAIEGLSPATKYYVRAYATNSFGTGYGNSVTFNTRADSTNLPVVSTSQVSAINDSSALVSGNVIYDGGFPITASGIVYSTDSLPTLNNSFNSPNNTFLSPGYFDCFLYGLSELTTYYARAYATNNKGTSYGNQLVFHTTENTNEFRFFKDQYTDTTLISQGYISSGVYRRSASFTMHLTLPPGIFFYVQVDSVDHSIYGGYSDGTGAKTFNNGDTVHLDGHAEYVISGTDWNDSMGDGPYPSTCTYQVKVGGRATTSDNSYYCKFYNLSGGSNTWEFVEYDTDSRQQCGFEH